MICHYCGYSESQTKVCPECGSGFIRSFKAGTQQIEEEVLTEERNAPEEIVELLKSGHHLNSITSFLCPVCREFRSNSSFVIREKLLDSPNKTAGEYKIHYLDNKPKCSKCDSELIYIENPKSSETKCPKCGQPSMKIKRIGSFD